MESHLDTEYPNGAQNATKTLHHLTELSYIFCSSIAHPNAGWNTQGGPRITKTPPVISEALSKREEYTELRGKIKRGSGD